MNQSFFARFNDGITALRARIGRYMRDHSLGRAPQHILLDDHLLRDIGMQGADALTLASMGIQRIDAEKPRTPLGGRRPAALF